MHGGRIFIKFLEDVGYAGSRHFDAHAYRTEDYERVKDFARGCMRTYLILKEKALQWNEDAEIQALLAEINETTSGAAPVGVHSKTRAQGLLAYNFDRQSLAAKKLLYERLDRITTDILLGVR